MNLEQIKDLIAKQKYREALKELDLINDSQNPDVLFVRGTISLKLKNYELAHEYFEKAISIKKKPEYYLTKGMAHFEMFELEDAEEAFLMSIELDGKDPTAQFFLSICYMFMEREDEATVHLKEAQKLNPKKTKQLLSNFYAIFIEHDNRISPLQKEKIDAKIKSIKV